MTFLNKYFFIILLGFIISIFIAVYINGIYEMKNIKNNAKFTVANIVSDWHYTNTKGGPGTDIVYWVKNKKIEGICEYNLRKGTKYLVMYDSLKPYHFLLLGHHQLPDSIKSPKNGWKFSQVPISIDSIQIKEYVEKYK